MCTIVEFPTQAAAEAAIAEYDDLARSLLLQMGYKQDENGNILGKNRRTGRTVDTAKTTTWDEARESPDATFYFRSPRSQGPQSEAMVQSWVDAGLCTEKIMPDEWKPDETLTA